MQTQTISGFQLAPQQKRLWQLQQNSSEFYCQGAVSISGNLQPEKLRNAVENVIRDHDILRTNLLRLPGVKTPVMVIEEKASFIWPKICGSPNTIESIPQATSIMWATAR